METLDCCDEHQSVRAKMVLGNEGIFEWDITIEEICFHAYIGVCALEDLDYEDNVAFKPNGWVLDFTGYCINFWNIVRHLVKVQNYRSFRYA